MYAYEFSHNSRTAALKKRPSCEVADHTKICFGCGPLNLNFLVVIRDHVFFIPIELFVQRQSRSRCLAPATAWTVPGAEMGRAFIPPNQTPVFGSKEKSVLVNSGTWFCDG